MKRNARLAFAALKKHGVAVYDRTEGYGAQFVIGTELRHNDDIRYADSYGEEVREHWDRTDVPISERKIINQHNVREDVWVILRKHNCRIEWINAALVGVYAD